MDINKIKDANTKYIGKNILYYEQVKSTQDKAKELVQNLQSGTIIIADMQTNGKGTKGRIWYNNEEAKNIAMTIVLKPHCSIQNLQGLTFKIAEILQGVIFELCNCNLQIKLPNDLMLNDKKICGILTECVTLKETVKVIYIGIGFNVNATQFNSEIVDVATSLKNELNREFCREDIIKSFIEQLEKAI